MYNVAYNNSRNMLAVYHTRSNHLLYVQRYTLMCTIVYNPHDPQHQIASESCSVWTSQCILRHLSTRPSQSLPVCTRHTGLRARIHMVMSIGTEAVSVSTKGNLCTHSSWQIKHDININNNTNICTM